MSDLKEEEEDPVRRRDEWFGLNRGAELPLPSGGRKHVNLVQRSPLTTTPFSTPTRQPPPPHLPIHPVVHDPPRLEFCIILIRS